jgi:hypothetical protein
MAADSNAPVRGTQSFVHTMSACWRRPSLTALEVLWRWGFGAPATAVVVVEAMRILRETPLDNAALQRMSLLDPMSAVDTVSQAATAGLNPMLFGISTASVSTGIASLGANTRLPLYGTLYVTWNRLSPQCSSCAASALLAHGRSGNTIA